MIKDRVAPPQCLFYVPYEIEKDLYTLIEQSVHYLLLKISIN